MVGILRLQLSPLCVSLCVSLKVMLSRLWKEASQAVAKVNNSSELVSFWLFLVFYIAICDVTLGDLLRQVQQVGGPGACSKGYGFWFSVQRFWPWWHFDPDEILRWEKVRVSSSHIFLLFLISRCDVYWFGLACFVLFCFFPTDLPLVAGFGVLIPFLAMTYILEKSPKPILKCSVI